MCICYRGLLLLPLLARLYRVYSLEGAAVAPIACVLIPCVCHCGLLLLAPVTCALILCACYSGRLLFPLLAHLYCVFATGGYCCSYCLHLYCVLATGAAVVPFACTLILCTGYRGLLSLLLLACLYCVLATGGCCRSCCLRAYTVYWLQGAAVAPVACALILCTGYRGLLLLLLLACLYCVLVTGGCCRSCCLRAYTVYWLQGLLSLLLLARLYCVLATGSCCCSCCLRTYTVYWLQGAAVAPVACALRMQGL